MGVKETERLSDFCRTVCTIVLALESNRVHRREDLTFENELESSFEPLHLDLRLLRGTGTLQVKSKGLKSKE